MPKEYFEAVTQEGTRPDALKSILKPDLAVVARLYSGEGITVTAGKQLFNPAKYTSFEVGPVTVHVLVQPGEEAGEAYARASAAAQVMLEAEYQIAKKLMESRLKENER